MTHRATFDWAVYMKDQNKSANCMWLEDALTIVDPGGTVRANGGKILWREGREAFPARDDIEAAQLIVWRRHDNLYPNLAVERKKHADRQVRKLMRSLRQEAS